MPVSLHECSSKAEDRELSQNKVKQQGQKFNEEKHKDNSQYLSTLPISAGKSARSRSSLDHAKILKGGCGPCQKRKQNKNGRGCKNDPGCRNSSIPTSRAKTYRIDRSSSTKEILINPYQGLRNCVIILPRYAKKT